MTKSILSTLIILFMASPSWAKEIAACKSNAPIHVDGLILSSEWPDSLFQSHFIQMEPQKGQPSTQKTDVAVQFDKENIYVAMICHKSYSDRFVASQTKRDQLEKKDDAVAICFDTYHDRRSAFWFMTNGLNTQVDARISDDGKYVDTNWDARWYAKSHTADSIWTIEFAVPFKSIRFDPGKETWGVNFSRFIPKTLETIYWAGVTDADFRVSRFGVLKGLIFPKPAFEWRLIPYGTARYETFSRDHESFTSGLDLEVRYRNNLTGNITYNPDFATVEGDREEINMTRWELSFPEKRTFFLEGSELFQNRIQAFYSRRIGEIDYGAKMIGKQGPYTYTLIGIQAKPVEDNPETESDESFPEYQEGIIRVKRDVFKSSTVGGMIIHKGWRDHYNCVFSLDGVFHFPKAFHFTTQFVWGEPGAFKDSYGGFVRLARENNIYHYHLRYTELAKNFKEAVNGIGFIQDDDRRELDSALEYKWWAKQSGIRFIAYDSNYNIYWSKTTGILRSWEIVQECKIYLHNKYGAEIEYVADFQRFEKKYRNDFIQFGVGHNTEEWASTELKLEKGRNFDRDYWMITASKNVKIHDKFSLEYELRKLEFDPDTTDSSTWLSIATMTYQFTPDLFVRLFTQYRSATNRLYIYGLFAWRFRLPNSAIYFVYTRDDFDRPLLSREKNEVIFLKCAYDFTL